MESAIKISQVELEREASSRRISEPDVIVTETVTEMRSAWPVHWTGVFVGALAAGGVASIIGLIGIALGAHLLGPADRVVDLRSIGIGTLALSIFGAFLAFVVGGWAGAKVAGIDRSEAAMLHGAIVWLVAVPGLFVLSALGAGSLTGGWYGGMASSTYEHADAPFDRPEPLMAGATAEETARFKADSKIYQANVKQWRDETPRVVRNTALGAITALLLGLMGAVVGGWMASGEPMTLTYRRSQSAAT